MNIKVMFNGNENVNVLNLPARADNCLKRLKIETLGDLANNINNLHQARGTGEKTILGIKSSLFNYAIETMTEDEIKSAIKESLNL